MQEAFEKILERLKDERECSYADFDKYVSEYSPCLDSEYDDFFHRGLERVSKLVKEIAEEFATDKNVWNNGWIPCSERLPELDGTYICTCQGIAESITLIFSTHDNSWNDEFKSEYDDVIAWQPLPEPYKESDKNGKDRNC